MKIKHTETGSIKLSANFYLAEFLESSTAERMGIDNTPDPLAIQNMAKMATLMEAVRKLLGDKVIAVSSCFRSVELNKAIKGSKTSDHLRGEAVDFVCRSFGSPAEIVKKIMDSDIQFGQLIYEGTWVHISLGTKREVLTAKFVKGQKTQYLAGLVL